MPTVKATAILPHVSGLPKDEDDLTFVIDSEDVDAAALIAALEVTGVIERFFTFSGTATHPLGYYIGNGVTRAASGCRIEYTDISTHLNGSAAGPPQTTAHFTMPAAGTPSDLPTEVAAVLTYYGSLRAAAAVVGPVSAIPTPARAQAEGAPATHSGKTHPKQSRTGRLYVGPLNYGTVGVVGGELRLDSIFVSNLGHYAVRLRDEVLALSVPSNWVVWSRKLAQVDFVVSGHIDNACDTQRRRGVASSIRSLWS